MFKLAGDRTLDIDRQSRGKFRVSLQGAFDSRRAGKFPVRRVVCRIQFRDPKLPVEIEVLQLPETVHRLSKRIACPADITPTLATTLAQVELTASKAGDRYSGWLEVHPSALGEPGKPQAVLEVLEQEYFPTSDEGQRGQDQDAFVMIHNRICAATTKFQYAIWI